MKREVGRAIWQHETMVAKLQQERESAAETKARLRRDFYDAFESWIWSSRSGLCNHAAEYVSYTEVPEESDYWHRDVWERRLGLCHDWLDSEEYHELQKAPADQHA